MDVLQAATPRRKQRRLPAKQPLGRQLLFKFLDGVEQHLHHVFYALLGGHQPGYVQPQPPGQRGAHLVGR